MTPVARCRGSGRGRSACAASWISLCSLRLAPQRFDQQPRRGRDAALGAGAQHEAPQCPNIAERHHHQAVGVDVHLDRFAIARLGCELPLRRVGMLAMLAIALAFAIFTVSSRPVALLAFAVLFGAGNGLIAIVRGGLVPELFGRTHVGRVGGLIAGISLMARAAAPLAAAWLLLALPGYQELMALLAACAAAAWLALLLVSPRRSISR